MQRSIRFTALFFTLFLFQITISKGITATDIDKIKIQQGDWVLRQGTSNDSRVILKLTNSQYSHIGVVVKTTPQILILHATTDDNPTAQNQVILSTLEHFLSPELAQTFVIIRPYFLTSKQQQQIVSLLLNELGKPFMLAARHQPHRYCTTIIEQAIQRVNPTFSPEWQQVELAFFSGEYLFPAAFLNYPNTRVVYQFSPQHE